MFRDRDFGGSFSMEWAFFDDSMQRTCAALAELACRFGAMASRFRREGRAIPPSPKRSDGVCVVHPFRPRPRYGHRCLSDSLRKPPLSAFRNAKQAMEAAKARPSSARLLKNGGLCLAVSE